MKTKQHGFTMIELIVVIVILGILAAVALPRFTNIQGDARIAKLNAARDAKNHFGESLDSARREPVIVTRCCCHVLPPDVRPCSSASRRGVPL